jgi:hypothetical protein
MAGNPLDHLVYGVPDLIEGVARIREQTGVEPVPGGRHERQATANYLIGLGGQSYLEIIGPDPDRDEQPGWFELARLTTPRLLTWAANTNDIENAVAAARAGGYDPGDAVAMSRRKDTGELLQWQLTPDTVATTGGVVPFLIDWGSGPHPSDSLSPQLRLDTLAVLSARPDETGARLAALDVALPIEPATAPGLRCVLSGPRGRFTLD